MPFIIRGERDTTREKRKRWLKVKPREKTQILITICFLMTLVASEKKTRF